MSKKDLTGQRYGRLLVIREVAPYISPKGVKYRRWLCRCDCGNELAVNQCSLTATKNGTRSCGCTRQAQHMPDLAGKRFGRLLVIEPAPLPRVYANGTKTGWLCRCDCGNEVVLPTRELTSMGTQSCGCLLQETARDKILAKNVTGRYSGTIVSAIRPERGANINNRSGHKGIYWSDREGRWIAKIGLRGKSITIGRFASLDAAVCARKQAEDKYFAPIIAEYDKED